MPFNMAQEPSAAAIPDEDRADEPRLPNAVLGPGQVEPAIPDEDVGEAPRRATDQEDDDYPDGRSHCSPHGQRNVSQGF